VSYFAPKYWQQFAIVAMEDGTEVDVSLTSGVDGTNANLLWRTRTYLFGETITIRMEKLQTAQLQSNKGEYD